jgi:hypothetical protein
MAGSFRDGATPPPLPTSFASFASPVLLASDLLLISAVESRSVGSPVVFAALFFAVSAFFSFFAFFTFACSACLSFIVGSGMLRKFRNIIDPCIVSRCFPAVLVFFAKIP